MTEVCYEETVSHALCIYVVIPFIFQESTFQVVLVSGKNMSFTLMHYGHISPGLHSVKVKQFEKDTEIKMSF